MKKETEFTILIVMLAWFGFGFLVGAIETGDERNHTTCSGKPGVDWKCVSDGKSGCIYESLSAFTMPGRIVACELFRKRFSVEGIGHHE